MKDPIGFSWLVIIGFAVLFATVIIWAIAR
jgi:hypothetical protein